MIKDLPGLVKMFLQSVARYIEIPVCVKYIHEYVGTSILHHKVIYMNKNI